MAFLSLHSEQMLPILATATPVLSRLKAWVGNDSGLLYRLWPALTGLIGKLPQPAARPFSRFAPTRISGRGRETIAFFVGCGLEAFFPQAGLAFLKICERLGIEVIIPKEQGCCGLLAASSGEINLAQDRGRHFLRQFDSLAVDYIVTACASCSYQLKQVHKLFPDSAERETAILLSQKIREASEYLDTAEKLASLKYLQSASATCLVFHDPCHLRLGQHIIEPPRRLLRGVQGVELLEPSGSALCCGQGGTFGICHPEMSEKIGRNVLNTYQDTGAGTVVTACSGCLAQLTGLAPGNLPVRHFLEILAEAI
jgi:glycolate oxidase iron-sulfur subunit